MGLPLLAISAVAGLVGAGISAAGAAEAGKATSNSLAYQSQVAANNAAIAKQNAIMDIQSGEVAAVNQGLKTRAQVGSEKANQGASGVDVNTGSTVAVRAGTEQIGMLDALTVRSNSAKKAFTDEVAATSDTAQSQLDTMGSQQASEAGEIGATGTLLSGVSTVGGNYARYQGQFGPSAGVSPS